MDRPLTRNTYSYNGLLVTHIILLIVSRYNTLDAEGPFQPAQRLLPQPPVAALRRIGRIRSGLAFTPDPQNARVCEIDSAPAIERVERLHDVVWLTRAHDTALICCVAGAIAPGDEGRHSPEPSLLRPAERFRPPTSATHGEVTHTYACWGHRRVSFLGPKVDGHEHMENHNR
jgi:hypothetical protein